MARSHNVHARADALSKTFPMLQHENAQHHRARIGAFQSCWSGLSTHLKVWTLSHPLLYFPQLNDRPKGLCKALRTCAGGSREGNQHNIQGARGVCKGAACGWGECRLWRAAPRPDCAGGRRKHELCGSCWHVLSARCLPPRAGETSGAGPHSTLALTLIQVLALLPEACACA